MLPIYSCGPIQVGSAGRSEDRGRGVLPMANHDGPYSLLIDLPLLDPPFFKYFVFAKLRPEYHF